MPRLMLGFREGVGVKIELVWRRGKGEERRSKRHLAKQGQQKQKAKATERCALLWLRLWIKMKVS